MIALHALPAQAPATHTPPAYVMQVTASQDHEFQVKDIVYQRSGGKVRLARLYQPAGRGPFPAVLQLHGGAWNGKDRTDGQLTALDREQRHRRALDRVPERARGALPRFTAGHQLRHPLAEGPCRRVREQRRPGRPLRDVERRPPGAARGHAPRRSALHGAAAGGSAADGRRSHSSSRVGECCFRSSATSWPGRRARWTSSEITTPSSATKRTEVEATPALILERGETAALPPALVYQGDADEWTTVALAERLATGYRRAGGTLDLQLLPGERHTFVNEHPFAPHSVKAVEMVKAFIRKYGAAKPVSH